MNKKEISELKRRFKKDECTFTKLCGCYVNGEKDIVLHFNETFLNLQDDEFFKYLEIAKKTLSGTIGNNLLELDFPLEEETVGGKQHFLMALKDSKLKNKDLLSRLYELIIENYDYCGNFLILVYHDAYDVMVKTSDNSKLDESEEVYEYLICAVCPVELTKPGLGYLADENKIGPRIRDWVVTAPDAGFVFPAFTDRSTDIHSTMFYTKNPKAPHTELMEALGCKPIKTAAKQKESFQTIICNAFEDDTNTKTAKFLNIQENINDLIDEHENTESSEPLLLTKDVITDILVENDIPETIVKKIDISYDEEFGDEPPVMENVIDAKQVAANAVKKKEQVLAAQVQELKQQLEYQISGEPGDTTSLSNADEEKLSANTYGDYDVVLNVKPQKVGEIHSKVIDGKKCLIIPVDEKDHVKVNGVERN